MKKYILISILATFFTVRLISCWKSTCCQSKKNDLTVALTLYQHTVKAELDTQKSFPFSFRYNHNNHYSENIKSYFCCKNK